MGLGGIKQRVWQAVASGYHLTGWSQARSRGHLVVLTYHRVLTAEELLTEVVQPGMYVRADAFRMQMEHLRANHDVLTFPDLFQRWETGSWRADRAACVITFDDGWLDNYHHAFPILKALDLPATIFLPTDFIGTRQGFWPERLSMLLRTAGAAPPPVRTEIYQAVHDGLRASWPKGAARPFPKDISAGASDDVIDACKQLDAQALEALIGCLCERFSVGGPATRTVMNWDEVREMSAQGITFGSHSCSHRLLDGLSDAECRKETADSLRVLRDNRAATVPVFCYPNGNYDAKTQAVVRAAGYHAAVSCRTGLEGPQPSDLFALKRVSLHHDISATPALFSMAIAGLR